MKVGRNDLCPCGSGRKFKRCHGATTAAVVAFERAEAREELRELASVFPDLRARSDELESFARRTAAVLAEGEEVAAEVGAEGAAFVTPADRASLVDWIAAAQPDEWERLCSEVGGPDAAERELVAGVVLTTIAEWRSRPRHLLEVIEDAGELVDAPLEALALALAPAHLWPVLEAAAAADFAAADVDDSGRWLDALAVFVDERYTPAHDERLRALSARLEGTLPIVGLPRASSLLVEGCRAVAADEEARREAAALLLANYVAYFEGPGLPPG